MNAPKMIPLKLIRIDGGTQARVSCPEDRIVQYVEDMGRGDLFPPIVVYFDGVDHWLADGFTRYFACKRREEKEILAEVREGTRRDALKHACGANATHGQPRSNADKRKAVLLVLGDPEWSLLGEQEIADICKVGRGLVNRMKRELAGQEEYPSRQKAPTTEPDEESTTDATSEGSQPLESVEDPAPIEDEDSVADTSAGGEMGNTVILDGVGIEITDPEMLERFAAVGRASEAQRILSQASKLVDSICQGHGGEHLAQDIGARVRSGAVTYKDHHIASAIRRLRQHLPFCSVCPYCHDAGHVTPSKKCTACHGHGYITRQQWEQCPEQLRQSVLDEYGITQDPSEEEAA